MAESLLLIGACDDAGLVGGDIDVPPVPWWSVTKTALAACALVLVARGRLSLDGRLPDRAYSLRQLLQHTSGLGSYTARPEVARARLSRLIAVRLARKQMTPATMTSRQSCSVVRQVRTRNMIRARSRPYDAHCG